ERRASTGISGPCRGEVRLPASKPAPQPGQRCRHRPPPGPPREHRVRYGSRRRAVFPLRKIDAANPASRMAGAAGPHPGAIQAMSSLMTGRHRQLLTRWRAALPNDRELITAGLLVVLFVSIAARDI